jgi:hypothetical protein
MMARRSLFSNLLAVAALPAIVGIIRPAHASISPHLAEMIGKYQTAADALAAIDDVTNPEAWDAAAEIEMQALQVLLDHRSASMAEFCAKFETLIPATVDDSEFYILRALLSDVHDLAEDAQ